mmetsp:Transcript_13550/g.22117  ORF Transcript_13550/g.22117 Transcript_13550/m.22117 type:complete len:119 (-) Transcript_13550:526-882(-)
MMYTFWFSSTCGYQTRAFATDQLKVLQRLWFYKDYRMYIYMISTGFFPGLWHQLVRFESRRLDGWRTKRYCVERNGNHPEQDVEHENDGEKNERWDVQVTPPHHCVATNLGHFQHLIL